jgi:hypothetical protein
MRRAYSTPRRLLTLLGVGVLILHVCALDAEAHGTSDQVVSTTPVRSDAGHASAIHVASCDGIKPGLSSAAPTTITNRTPPETSAVTIRGRLTLEATHVPIPRPPLFLLHASLLI